MGQHFNRLTVKAVEHAKSGARLADGGGLYLDTTEGKRGKGGARRWIFRYRHLGKEKVLGFGSARSVTLARARELAAEAREHVATGTDPAAILGKKARDEAAKAAVAAEAAEAEQAEAARRTFGDVAEDYIETWRASWRNPKVPKQWRATLENDAAHLWSMAPADITRDDVFAVLKPIWATKAETASRLRGRIERILDAAHAEGLRPDDNPARMAGWLKVKLGPHQRRKRHHPALPYEEVGAFVRRLRSRDAVAARALELVILTAVRSGEALGARWEEFDLERKLWTIPRGRMKSDREHRVPLSPQVVALLERLKPMARGQFVFPTQAPGSTADAPLSYMSMLILLRRMKTTGVTAHGFRSTFRDWAAEETETANIVAEQALAHVVRDGTEAAYRRGDLFERRRLLMNAWADFCEAAPRLKAVGE